MGTRDRAVVALAARQAGVVSCRQLHALGLDDAAVHRRVANGMLERVGNDVVRVHGFADTTAARLMLATLADPASVVSHCAASWNWEMEPIVAGRPTVTTTPSSTHQVAGVRVRRSTRMPPSHVTIVGDLRVTTRIRTILDLAADLPLGHLARLLDGQLLGRHVELTELIDELEAHAAPGRRGIQKLRVLLVERSDGLVLPESELERRFRVLLRSARLPEPSWQYRPPWGGSLIGRVDAAWVDRKLIVELDGRRWHSRDEAFEADRRRDQLAAVHGWRVVRFTWRQVVDDPSAVIRVLQALLR